VDEKGKLTGKRIFEKFAGCNVLDGSASAAIR